MKVLIAEDEPMIADLYKTVLEDSNHQVELAKDGNECHDIYLKELYKLEENNSQTFPFDMVVLDIMMPKKDGLTVAKEILDVKPTQRVIFASAFVKETIEKSMSDLNLNKIIPILQKPFKVDSLLEIIEDNQNFEKLDELSEKLRSIESLDPSNMEMVKVHEELSKMIKADVWYAFNNLIFA